MKPKSEPPFDPQTVGRLFEANFAELRQWTDTTASPYALLHIRREWRQGRLGEVLKLLQQQITRDPTDLRLHRKRIQIFRDLGWENWADHEQQWLPVRFPKSYPGF